MNTNTVKNHIRLLDACRTNSWGLLPEMKDAGIDFSADGNQALKTAILYGHKGVVIHLLCAGVLPDIGADNIISPLQLAARTGNYDIVKLLLNYGSRVESIYPFQRVIIGKIYPKIDDLLKEYGTIQNN